ncbi:MAG: TerB N-terminal domain-containing protein [Lachnospiraceae bacterium]|nr:TerB N-terminal domain-containing protein [Lachnospiraceae bacterium]
MNDFRTKNGERYDNPSSFEASDLEEGDFDYTQDGFSYEDEPIRLSPERTKELPPKEYRQMRSLAFGSPFSRNYEAKIFYLQARYMESFEDDCPYDREVRHYFPTYQSLSTEELRGYFTWRTRLRRGQLEKTSLTYAYLYVYELLHQIGAATVEEGLENLIWFYEQYRSLDPDIRGYTEQWIVDYAVYYNQPAEKIRAYTLLDSDEDLYTLLHYDSVSDEELFPAILKLSKYHLEGSKAFKQYPEELKQVITTAYRKLNEYYQKRYQKTWVEKLYGAGSVEIRYIPFQHAIFYDRGQREHYAYSLGPLQRYRCDQNRWSCWRDSLPALRNQELGVFVRAADRLFREEHGIHPSLKFGDETKTMEKFIHLALREVIADQKKAARSKIEFDLSLLGDIRRSSEAIGQKLMTEEERYIDAPPYTKNESFKGNRECEKTESHIESKYETGTQYHAEFKPEALPQTCTVCRCDAGVKQQTEFEHKAVASDFSGNESTDRGEGTLPLSDDELRFVQLLLYGGDLPGFLSEIHRMASLLAESVNEKLYDTFADTVIEFDGDAPVIVEDYLDDLKGMIPS